MSDSEDESYRQYEVKEGIVFLIDLHLRLLEPNALLNGKSQIMEILASVYDLMADMIITSSRNGVGVYFYNCGITSRKFKRDSSLNRVFRLNDLNSLSMKKLAELIEDGVDAFKEEFPPAEHNESILPSVFSALVSEFNAKKYTSKKLVWITSNDKPYTSDEIKTSLRTYVNDFDRLRIRVTPLFLPVSAPDGSLKPFDLTKYQDIFINTNYLTNEEGKTSLNDYTGSVFNGVSRGTPAFNKTTVSTKIRSAILRAKEVKRIQFSCNLILSDGAGVQGNLGCSVKGYTLYNHEKLRTARNLYNQGESLKVVHLRLSLVNSSNHQPVNLDKTTDTSVEQQEDAAHVRRGFLVKKNDEEDVIFHFGLDQMKFMKNYAFEHGACEEDDEDEIPDSYEEDKSLGYSKPPYLKLLGFRNIKGFRPFYNEAPAVFMTADLNNGLTSSTSEGGFSSSFATFSSLYQSCVKLEKYAIVVGCTKQNAKPTMYAMYPTNISNSRVKHLTFPEGFLLIKLPWLNDMRSLPDYILTQEKYRHSEDDKLLEGLLELYKEVIESHLIDHYNPGKYPNPSLNYFYKVIRHELLQEELPSEETEVEKNDVCLQEVISLRNELEQEENKKLLPVQVFLNKLANSETAKRSNDTGGPAQKKPKLSEEAVLTAWKHNEWDQFTVAQLKEFTSKYPEIKKGTRKQDIIDNISQFLDKREQQG